MSNPRDILHVPTVIRALIWAERTTVFNPGKPDEHISTKRSHETFCVSGSTPEELMQAFLECRQLNSPEQLFIKS